LAAEQNNHLVSAAIQLGPIPEHLIESMEPMYPVLGSTGLCFPPEYHKLLADYFCHCIARDPNDLRSHVRRIFLEREQGRNIRLYAALFDLFIALGNRGSELRHRMLRLAKANLEPHQYNLLHESLAKGLDSIGAPIVHGSVLSRGIEGTLDLVSPAVEERTGPRDALIEAREYLEYSQLDEARSLLERAVLQEPQRSDLHLELLAIYRSTRNESNFAKMVQELDGMTNPVPKAWQELAEFFRSRNV
jgi:hypothetical protein